MREYSTDVVIVIQGKLNNIFADTSVQATALAKDITLEKLVKNLTVNNREDIMVDVTDCLLVKAEAKSVPDYAIGELKIDTTEDNKKKNKQLAKEVKRAAKEAKKLAKLAKKEPVVIKKEQVVKAEPSITEPIKDEVKEDKTIITAITTINDTNNLIVSDGLATYKQEYLDECPELDNSISVEGSCGPDIVKIELDGSPVITTDIDDTVTINDGIPVINGTPTTNTQVTQTAIKKVKDDDDPV